MNNPSLNILDDAEVLFFRNLLDFAKENKLLINWSSKSFSINIVKDGNNINILRAYCKLSSFGQSLFATAGNISTQFPGGELILEEYKKLDDFTSKVSDGYIFNIKEMNDEQSERLYEVLSKIVDRIKSH